MRRAVGLLARALLLLGGAAFTANAAWLAVTANLTLGTALVAFLGLSCLACGIWFTRLKGHRLLTALASLVLAAFLGLSVFLTSYGTADNTTYDENAVIVLGAAVHGRELSRTLVGRLDVAVGYHERSPSALIVVSGGQGLQEEIPEAVAISTRRVQLCSTLARCRMSPSNDSVDGGTERVASWPASSPSHFSSNVSR